MFLARFGWIWSVVLWLWPMARSHHSGYTSTVEPLLTKVAVWNGGDARRKRVRATMFFKTCSNFNVILQNFKFWITLVILDSLKTNYMFSLLALNQHNGEQNKDLKKNTQEFYNGMIIIQIISAFPRSKQLVQLMLVMKHMNL